MAFKFLCILVSLVCSVHHTTWAFPNGGPIDACVKANANQPNHSGISPQAPETNPFSIEASSDYYRPGETITVTIRAPKSAFKGFFFQGRDARTNEWIGTFEKHPEVKSYPECSAATHTGNEPKEAVTLLWHAPADRGAGNVYFIGTVLANYKTFWSDVVADVRQ